MQNGSEHQQMVTENILQMQRDQRYNIVNQEYLEFLLTQNYQYNFSWFGRPIIQIPQDIYALQEMVWQTKPDLIIETGIAHGGSLVLAASLMAQLDMLEALTEQSTSQKLTFFRKRHVLGVDIEIREHNKVALLEHPLNPYYTLIEGSSISKSVINKVKRFTSKYEKIMLLLDSNHTHSHVLKELQAYAPLVSVGCYLVVWDSGIEDVSETTNKIIKKNRPWARGNNPKTALIEYLDLAKNAGETYQINSQLRTKIGISSASDAFLRKVGKGQ